MKLTREQAITEHRKMWNWIANMTEKLKRKIEKEEYFFAMRIKDIPRMECYCCEYNDHYMPCANTCIINWGEDKGCMGSYFVEWDSITDDWRYAARLARIIANLPERKVDE